MLNFGLLFPSEKVIDSKMCQRLFPTNLPERQWSKSPSDGFSQPAACVIYHDGGEQERGMPIGGIGTGYVNLNLDGCLGEWTIYNNLVNPRTAMTMKRKGKRISTGSESKEISRVWWSPPW